jgi:hypothetical protein
VSGISFPAQVMGINVSSNLKVLVDTTELRAEELAIAVASGNYVRAHSIAVGIASLAASISRRALAAGTLIEDDTL